MPATLVFADREIGWTAFDDAVQRAASGLERLGVAEGDVVCFMLRNEPAFLEVVFAARPARARTPARSTGTTRRTRPAGSCADSGAKALVVAPTCCRRSQRHRRSRDRRRAVGAATVAAFGIAEAARAFHRRPEWDEWVASHPPYAGPTRTPARHAVYLRHHRPAEGRAPAAARRTPTGSRRRARGARPRARRSSRGCGRSSRAALPQRAVVYSLQALLNGALPACSSRASTPSARSR